MPFVIDPPFSPPLPPAPEDASELWELLYSSLGFHVEDDEAQGFALRKFCESLCAPMQSVYDLVREREGQAGWAIVFDVDNCPAYALPYLAQYVGVQITPEMSEEQIRDEIREPTGWKRGQPESIRIAARRTLTGEDPLVILRARTPEVGRTFVRTLTANTPDPTRTEAVIRAALPAWEVLDYAAIEGVVFDDLTGSEFTTFEDVAAAFPTFRDLTEALPGEL
jgi:hypothetical protein